MTDDTTKASQFQTDPQGRIRARDYFFKVAAYSVDFTMDPGAKILSASDSENGKDSGIKMEPAIGPLGSAITRKLITKSHFFLSSYVNKADKPQELTLEFPQYGAVQAIDLSQCGGEIYTKPDVFIACDADVTVSSTFTFNLRANITGHMNVRMQKISGDGLVFVGGPGRIKEQSLAADQNYDFQGNELLAYTPDTQFDLSFIGLRNKMATPKKDWFYLEASGPGKIWRVVHPNLA